MSMYSYNGVQLDKLPSHNGDYQFAYLVAVPKKYEPYFAFKYILTYSTHQAVYDSDTGDVYIPKNVDWECKQYEVAPQSTQFVLSGTYTNNNNSALSLTMPTMGGFTVQWANTDIYDVDAHSVYVAASMPELVSSFHIKSFLSGLAVGRALKGVSDVQTVNYVTEGICLEFTLKANKWNGTTYSLSVSNHGTNTDLRLGLPIHTSAINAKRMVQSALTLPYVRTYNSDGVDYITMDISATYAPTEDITVAIWGFQL